MQHLAREGLLKQWRHRKLARKPCKWSWAAGRGYLSFAKAWCLDGLTGFCHRLQESGGKETCGGHTTLDPNPSTLHHSANSAKQVECYGRGRVFLAGDACHCHSPFGGQGLRLPTVGVTLDLRLEPWALSMVTYPCLRGSKGIRSRRIV